MIQFNKSYFSQNFKTFKQILKEKPFSKILTFNISQ